MRINLFGGPGTGKSTLAARVFGRLRQQGVSCALVTEWIKMWAYEGRTIRGYDQVFSFANQLHSEEESLRYAGMIITDSPMFLQCMYADKHAKVVANDLWNIAANFEADYPSINFYIERSGPYEQHGRWENEEQALQMDAYIKAKLDARCLPITYVYRDDVETIMSKLKHLRPVGIQQRATG